MSGEDPFCLKLLILLRLIFETVAELRGEATRYYSFLGRRLNNIMSPWIPLTRDSFLEFDLIIWCINF